MVARILLVVTVGLLVPSLGRAQDSSASAQVVALLRSNTSTGVAWGAFEAATFQITEAVPAMIAALETLPPGSQHERDYVAAALLDALVQIRPVPGVPPGPQVPASVVAPYLERWPIQTLILLGRSGPDGDPIILDLLRSWPSSRRVTAYAAADVWFALANLLAARTTPGFAAFLLQDLRFELVITVSETESVATNFNRGGITGEDGFAQKPNAFPPHALYRWDSQREGNIVLSTGPRTLYYSRSVTSRIQFGVGDALGPLPTVNDRLTYLSAIARQNFRASLDERIEYGIKWANAAMYRNSVAEKRREIERGYSRLIERLVNQGRLTPDEAARLPLRLTTAVRDERRDRSRPLPQIASD